MPVKEYNPQELQQTNTPSDTGAQGGPPTISGLGSLGRGALKGLSSTVSSADEFARQHLPAFMTNTKMGFGKPANLEEQRQAQKPANDLESLGKGIEQAGEFMLPGVGEEALAAKAGKFSPLARVGYNALTTGMLNKAQGGSGTLGAVAGAGGSLLGQGARALAPQIAEKAIGITKADRGFSKSPGEAIINETTGVRPATIERQAKERVGQLAPQVEKMARNASRTPAPPIRGLLQAPQNEIPLNRPTIPRATRGGLFEAGVNPEPNEPRSGNPFAPISEYPGINPHYLSGTEHPELSGRYAPPKGTLLSREATGGRQPVDEFGRVVHPEPEPFTPRPEFNPVRSASLAPGRNAVSSAMGQAVRQNAEKEYGQLEPMNRFLQGNFRTGEVYPENVTPEKLLDLRRGFNTEFGHWNPETLPGVSDVSREAYHGLTGEFHRAVPGSEPLDRRISNLIPVAARAGSTSRNAPIMGRTLGRIGAGTGALLGGVYGANEGRREGGTPGMILGGAAGLIGPELIASPEGQMIVARTMASPTARNLIGSPIKGGLLQLNRKDEDR